MSMSLFLVNCSGAVADALVRCPRGSGFPSRRRSCAGVRPPAALEHEAPVEEAELDPAKLLLERPGGGRPAGRPELPGDGRLVLVEPGGEVALVERCRQAAG
jgi:hypothetical protein